jgi:hypothetical protein
MRNAYKYLVRIPEERDYSGGLSVDGSIILKRILKRKKGVRMWTGLTCLRIGSRGGSINTVI